MEETSHRQPTVKRIVQEPTEMEDPSVRYFVSVIHSQVQHNIFLKIIRFDDIVQQCTKPIDHIKLSTEKGEKALAASLSVLKRLKDDGCDLVSSIYLSKFSECSNLLNAFIRKRLVVLNRVRPCVLNAI